MNRIRSFFGPLCRHTIPRPLFNLVLSSWLVLFYNNSLWQLMTDVVTPDSLYNVAILLAFMLFIIVVLNALLSLFVTRTLHKLVAIFMVLCAASVSYFMDAYHVIIDKSMIRNIFQTDVREAYELVTPAMLLNFLLMGLLPATLIATLNIEQRPIVPALKSGLVSVLLSLIIALLMIGSFYKDFSLVFRENRQIRYLITPTNYIYYSLRYLSGAYTRQDRPLVRISDDAMVKPDWQPANGHRPLLTLIIVGETARAQNFALNGYSRPTNPALSQREIINFSDVTACGTSTAISLPCMFSDLPRRDFDVDNARYRENLMDIFSHTGFHLQWRENNSGCKGVCDRIEELKPVDFSASSWCKGKDCFDEAMLEGLDQALPEAPENTVITLHQLGSHGPAYNLRYPAAFEHFTPVCDRADVASCSQQELVNGYDNSIIYTDYLIDQSIRFLEQQAGQYDTSLIYVSDHGESLGENGLYLHGLPWFMAPDTQKKVPMVVWLSAQYQQRFPQQSDCLKQRAAEPVSHDHLFHSLLGMNGIESTRYDATLDLSAPCG